MKVKSLRCVRPSVTPWTAAYQAPLSMGFSRQEYWSGVPLPSPYTSKVRLKIPQARIQQYVNHELSDVQAGFRKSRGTRDQIANIHWIIKKAREFQNYIYFRFIDYAKAFDCMDDNKLENSSRAWYFHLFQNLLQFIVIHTVQHFGIDNKAEIDFFFFLESSCFFNDPRLLAYGSLVPLPFRKPV